MISKESIENYGLEIMSRSGSIQARCSCFLSREYIDHSPINLANTIKDICEYLSKVVVDKFNDTDWEDDVEIEYTLRILKKVDRFIKKLGQHLLYVDMARNENLPWSIIPSFKKLVEKLLPDNKIDIILLPGWEYNYTVDLRDIRSIFNIDLVEFQDITPPENNLLKELPRPLHIITFPLLERKNMRLHSLLGHEIGHLFAQKYINQVKLDKFINSINSELDRLAGEEFKKSHSGQELLEPAIKNKIKVDFIAKASIIWYRCLQEILSDIVCAIVFGPSALFSCYDFAIQDDLDIEPSEKNKFYPPWRMRLREIIKVMNGHGLQFLPIKNDLLDSVKASKINATYDKIFKKTQVKTDIDKINRKPVLGLVYNQIQKNISEATKFFLEDCNLREHQLKTEALYEKLPFLIERLENGIPPNAVEKSVNERKNATLVEIINASWFHKITWQDSLLNGSYLNKELLKKRNRMNNLTLKAIEFSHLEEEYNTFMEKKDR